MLDYKDILNKYYVIRLSAREISRQTGMSKSGVLKFIHAFEKCDELDFPLPPGITNAGIAMKVYGKVPGEGGRDESYEYPDYPKVLKLMNERKNMTLQVCWDRYVKRCMAEEKKPYQYRQFCELFGKARFMCGYRMEQFAFFRLMRLAQNIIAYAYSTVAGGFGV